MHGKIIIEKMRLSFIDSYLLYRGTLKDMFDCMHKCSKEVLVDMSVSKQSSLEYYKT